MESATASAASPFGLSTIGQIGTTVTDVERAIAFYRDTLGIPFLFQVPNMGFFDCGGIRLMLTGSEKPGEQFSPILYFKVPDIHAAFETMTSRGAAFEGEPHLVAQIGRAHV